MEKYPYIKRYLEMGATGNAEYIKNLMEITEAQIHKRNYFAKLNGKEVIPVTEDNIKKEVDEFLKNTFYEFSQDFQLING